MRSVVHIEGFNEMRSSSNCTVWHKPAGGFTLVELLVVISIIALLLAILMPSLSAARQQAKKIVCSSNLRQQGIALYAYRSANNGRYPSKVRTGFWAFGGMVTDGNPLNGKWDNLIAGQPLLVKTRFLDDFKFLYCPASPKNYLNYKDMFNLYQQAYLSSHRFEDMNWGNLFINYPYWAGYTKDFTTGSGYNFGTKAPLLIVSGLADTSSKIVITDATITWPKPTAPAGTDLGKFPYPYGNHVSRGVVEGGNILRNDGSVSWQKMAAMQKDKGSFQHTLRLISNVLDFWF
jgi:prepilin-type N-terminal cleavage/methylation domain-containing protein